ncbi:MAG: hypothetical protein EDX89_06965 [Acidobacteria bacterium]|nr:MAG: hypothetical protein EDX89_06965 [Acidobacteriota bacterium]
MREGAANPAFRTLRIAADAILALLALLVLLPLAYLPWRLSRALGRGAGRLFLLFWPSARRVAALNLRRAYGESMTPSRARRLTARCVASLGEAIAEAAQLFRLARGGGDPVRLFTIEDPALAERLLSDPRPKVVVTGHLGSWEANGLVLSHVAGGGAAVYRRIENVFLDRLVARAREAFGGRGIEKRGAAREALAELRAGRSVLFLGDENAGYRGLFVDFFGRPASTSRTPALLSAMTGAPLVVTASVRRPGPVPFLFRLASFEPPSGRRATPEDVRDLTARAAATWERWVREDPEQWRWVHWRWKTRPDGTEETYRAADVRAAFAETTPPVALGEEPA